MKILLPIINFGLAAFLSIIGFPQEIYNKLKALADIHNDGKVGSMAASIIADHIDERETRGTVFIKVKKEQTK